MTQHTLHHGDCLEYLSKIPPVSVQAVITDPPYMIGATSVGKPGAKCGTWADMENSAFWFSHWFNMTKRALKPDGYLLVFGNWRSIPTLIRAFDLSSLTVSSCLIWNKEWIGPGGPSALRPTYEIVMFAAMPEARIVNRSASDIYTCKWMASSKAESGHPAEKPVQLMRHLIHLVAPNGGVIVDPFMGSGTTGVAALAEGCDFIGIEREQRWLELAQRRMSRPDQLGLSLEVPA
jgi:site-specific DNA-methyltransferase (adenine-specific)